MTHYTPKRIKLANIGALYLNTYKTMLEGIQNPYRITLEHYDQKITVEMSNSSVSIDQAMQTFRSVLLAAGYPEKSISEYIKPE